MSIKIFSIAILFLALSSKTRAQGDLDNILRSLDNKDLYVAIILRGSNWLSRTEADNNELRKAPKIQQKLVTISSMDISIDSLARKYSKKILAQKLYPLLQDSNKDLYANALLTELFDPYNLTQFQFLTKEKWNDSGKRTDDLKKWEAFFAKEENLQYDVLVNPQ